jgi:hypothetical protein
VSRSGEGRGLVIGLVGVLTLSLGALALWLSKKEDAPAQVPASAPAKPSPVELAAPTSETFLPVPAEPPKPPEPLRLPAELEQQRETSTRMRSELRESLGAVAARPSDPASAGDDPPAPPPPALDKEYIRDRIREDLVPVAVECYESVLADQPDAGGKIVMSFAILGDPDVGGVVDEAAVDTVQSDFDNAFLRECMTQSLMALHFDAPPEGGRVEVTYPFVFEPGEDE